MYDDFAPDYDRFVNWPERLVYEMPFIESWLKKIPSNDHQPLRILDAACGTGQHAIALAHHGYQVSGADLSLPMIGIARSNAQAAYVLLDLKAAAFGYLSAAFGASQFDAILCLGNSLPHLLNAAELQKTLNDFAACLRPGGLLLIQNRNFDMIVKQYQRWMEPQPFTDGKIEWLFVRFYDFEANGLIRFNVVTLKRPFGGDWTSSNSSAFLKPQLNGELCSALAAAGFTGASSFGSMSGDAYDPVSSGNLILTAFSTKTQ